MASFQCHTHTIGFGSANSPMRTLSGLILKSQSDLLAISLFSLENVRKRRCAVGRLRCVHVVNISKQIEQLFPAFNPPHKHTCVVWDSDPHAMPNFRPRGALTSLDELGIRLHIQVDIQLSILYVWPLWSSGIQKVSFILDGLATGLTLHVSTSQYQNMYPAMRLWNVGASARG
jgi:hypothetical protein